MRLSPSHPTVVNLQPPTSTHKTLPQSTMASEPNPADQESEIPPVPASAEDRKAAAALSNLETRGADDDAVAKRDVDTEALGKAMQNLDVSKKDGATAEPAVKKKIKVEAVDVALLVSFTSCCLDHV
jgi:hypothetical protein